MDYEEALERLNERGGKMEWGEDLGADEEETLTSARPAAFRHQLPQGR